MISLALRNVLKNKGFTFINIFGLAIGLCASFFILLWLQDELSYDRFNINAENIYRVEEDQFYSGERYHVTVTPYPSGPVWKEKIPEIMEQSRIDYLPRILFRHEEKVFFESSIIAADSGLFRIFTMPFIAGDPETALREPHSIILTEKLARKYFGDNNPLGTTLILENNRPFTITGVIKDLPKNSTFRFDGVIPFSYLYEVGAASQSWGNNSILTFVLCAKGVDTESVNKKLTDVVLEYLPQTRTKYTIFPLPDIHLHSQFGFEKSNGPVIMIYIFTLIALFIILIASFNFINLSTAKASGRAKEIGIKKVAGADQKTLIIQFMTESFFLVLVAMIFGLLLVGLTLPLFNDISGKSFVLSDLFEIRFLLSVLVTAFLTGIIAGLYPAFYLASFKPVTVLKGESGNGKGGVVLRKILVVLQFSLSVLIAIVTIFMFLQLKHLQNKDLGFNKEDLLSIRMPIGMKEKYYTLKSELVKEPLIKGVTAAQRNPVRIGSNSGGADWDGKDPEKQVLIGTNAVDYDYLETMEMKLTSGRGFSREYTSDLAKDTTGNFLVNEEVVKLMGTDDAVGMRFSFMGLHGRIVGVLKNFNFKGADQPIEPIAFALGEPRYLDYILIRLTKGDVPAALKTAESVWNRVIPEYPFEYTFLSEEYNDLFRSQVRLTGLLKYFTLLAIIIACLGLYGLSAYSAQKRTNEIGIRKVMGADIPAIIYSMVKEFILLIFISLIIAVPSGWLVVSNLLSQFASHIEIQPLIFFIICVGTLVLALLTVSLQAYKASRINPAVALKSE